MKLKSRICVLVLGLALAPSFHQPLWGQDAAPNATVQLRIVDLLGQEIGDVKVALFRSTQGTKDFANRFRNNSAPNIPFDTYLLRAYAPGFSSAERIVPVYHDRVSVLLELYAGEEGGTTRYHVSGRVKNQSYGAEISVRLAGVSSGFVLDSEVDKAGAFAIGGVPRGHYVLITRQGAQPVQATLIEVPLKHPLTVNLHSPP